MTSVPAIEVVIGASDAELAADLLWTAGVSAVAEHPLDDGRVLLRSDVPPPGVDGVRAALAGLAVDVTLVEVDDGLDAWRDHAQVVRAGRRLVVRPPWLPLDDPGPDALVIEIDPERSWGHGAHPTTRLCLAEVERACDDSVRPLRVLDVGCGSGSLGIAAALLGAGSVVACDIDPAAVGATRRNAERNGVAHLVDVHLLPPPPAPGRRIDVESTPTGTPRRIDVESTPTGTPQRIDVESAPTGTPQRIDVDSAPTGSSGESGDPLGGIGHGADLIVANIGAAALVDLAPHLLRRIAPGGTIFVSGLLDPPPREVAAAFAPLQVARAESIDGWAALVLR